MSVSDIAVTALTAVATIKGNQLTITTSDPRSGALPNIALDHVDIYASQTDTFASASVVAQGTLRALHANAGEGQAWFYWGIPYDKLGAAGTRYPSGATGGVACTSLDQVGLAFGLSNAKLVPSVASNNLTVALKTAAGNDPSASDSVTVAFRNSTLATGSYQIRQITAALSLTYNSGGSTPPAANEPFRLWVLLFDDGGTLRLAITLRSGSGSVFSLPASGISSTVSDGGMPSIITPGVTVSSKSFRVIGYMDWSSGLSTGGSFNVLPDVVRMFGADVPLPGTTLQCIESNLAVKQTGTTVVPYDDTIPQRAESDSYFTYSITPQSMCNQLEHRITMVCAHSAAGANPIAVMIHYQSGFGPTADAIAASLSTPPAANVPVAIPLNCIQAVPQSTQIGYEIHAAGTTAGTLTVDGVSGARKFGGALNSSYALIEYQG